MADCFIYEPDCGNFATLGKCGRLTPLRLDYMPSAGALPELVLEHPIDPAGRHSLIQTDWVLKTSVPVRESPDVELENAATTTITRRIFRVVVSSHLRLREGPGTNTRILGAYDNGTRVIEMENDGGWKRVCLCKGGATGWMYTQYLTDTGETVTDTVGTPSLAVRPAVSRPQLFRIYAVNRTDKKITAYARGIAGDALYNLTTYNTEADVDLQTALNGTISGCLDACRLTARTNIQGTRKGVDARDKNPISAILDPEEGLAARWDAQLVIDDDKLYLLDRAGFDRGVHIEYAVNLTGVDMDVNTENVCTHIRPIGQTKDGKPLYLSGNDGLVACPNAEEYPFKRIYPLEVSEAQVGSGMSTSQARAKMQEAAQEMIDSGAYEPEIGVKLSFVDMGTAPRYAQYRALSQLFIYDTVHVRHPVLGIEMTTMVLKLTWDCLLDRATDMELGQIASRMPTVPSWSLPNGINGAKIAGGSVRAGQLADEVISARHVQSESINASAINTQTFTADTAAVQTLCAHALNAVTAHINALTAGTITTDSLVASVAHMLSLTAGNISAQGIQTDTLAAQLADIAVLCAGTGTFSKATVQHLVAQAMNLEYGVGDTVSIANLKVAYAQLAEAAIGNLCLKASNGNYYSIDVDANGAVTATQATVTQAEIEAGQTSGGRVILDTDITAANLSTANLLGTYALINRIDAARIDVDQLVARQAFIDSLNTSLITGNEIIRMVAESAAESPQRTADNAKAVTDELVRYLEFIRGEGLRQHVPLEDSTYSTLVDETGFHIEQLREKIASFYKRKLVVENVSVGRLRADSRIVLRAAADGGLIFEVEDVQAEINAIVGTAIVGSAIVV